MSDQARRCSKDHVIDPCAGFLKPRAPLLLLLKLADQLIHNSTRKASVGDHLSTDFIAEDTPTQSMANYSAILVWQMSVIGIPSNR
jgi:hypothetical protein